MRIYSIVLIFLVTLTAKAEPNEYGSLRLTLSTDHNRRLEKLAVQFRFEPVNVGGNLIGNLLPFERELTTDSSGVVLIENLPEKTYKVHIQSLNFDDYSLENLQIKAGEITEIEIHLEAAEELPFVRLPKEEIENFINACYRWKRPNSGLLSFDDSQSWAELWSELNLVVPPVDFKAWKVLAYFTRSGYVIPRQPIRRVTYNSKNKLIRVRLVSADQIGEIRSPAVTCIADFILIPPRDGNVAFH